MSIPAQQTCYRLPKPHPLMHVPDSCLNTCGSANKQTRACLNARLSTCPSTCRNTCRPTSKNQSACLDACRYTNKASFHRTFHRTVHRTFNRTFHRTFHRPRQLEHDAPSCPTPRSKPLTTWNVINKPTLKMHVQTHISYGILGMAY